MVTILMISTKMTTLKLLKIKVFRNNSYDAMISPHYVTNKVLSRDSNYFVDLVMSPKFGNSNIFMIGTGASDWDREWDYI